MYKADDDQDLEDDEDVVEERDDDVDNEGGVGFGHHHENSLTRAETTASLP